MVLYPQHSYEPQRSWLPSGLWWPQGDDPQGNLAASRYSSGCHPESSSSWNLLDREDWQAVKHSTLCVVWPLSPTTTTKPKIHPAIHISSAQEAEIPPDSKEWPGYRINLRSFNRCTPSTHHAVGPQGQPQSCSLPFRQGDRPLTAKTDGVAG